MIATDTISQKFILLAMEHYVSSLKLSTKHVYQALPRLLSLWFDFVSIEENHVDFDSKSLNDKKGEILGKGPTQVYL